MTLGFFLTWLAASLIPGADDCFAIKVVDEETGRGVPLVELRTVNSVRYYTDSNGIVAFREPGLMGQTVYFHVRSHGYEVARDGFGFRGTRLKIEPGGRATLKIKRINIAQRLYRVTGAGIYRDTILSGEKSPLAQPVLNGRVFGSDSVVNAVFRGRIYWFWGDTNQPSYPLGNFHVPGATSLLPHGGGLDPLVGVDLEYFVDQTGFVKPTAQMPGSGPTWIDGLVAVTDESGRERLFAKYVKVEPPLKVYQRGLVEFNADENRFEKRVQFDMSAPLFPAGHPFKLSDDHVEYVYFATPYPLVRVRATPQDLQDLARYEAYTCFKEGSREDDLELDRGPDSKLRYGWKKNSNLLTLELQRKLIADGRLKENEAFYRLRDVETGKRVSVHSGSVSWNVYRGRWVMIAVESFGSSMLGEVWYSEAASPVGPWTHARRIVTHDQYSFYNPKQHPMFDQERGRIIFFEGTYANTFSGNPDQTPWYDYNQIMYQLDLSDPRLAPAVFHARIP